MEGGAGNGTLVANGTYALDSGTGTDSITGDANNNVLYNGDGLDSYDADAGEDRIYMDAAGISGTVRVHLGQDQIFDDGFGNTET